MGTVFGFGIVSGFVFGLFRLTGRSLVSFAESFPTARWPTDLFSRDASLHFLQLLNYHYRYWDSKKTCTRQAIYLFINSFIYNVKLQNDESCRWNRNLIVNFAQRNGRYEKTLKRPVLVLHLLFVPELLE